jgi:hypothetical protein
MFDPVHDGHENLFFGHHIQFVVGHQIFDLKMAKAYCTLRTVAGFPRCCKQCNFDRIRFYYIVSNPRDPCGGSKSVYRPGKCGFQ